MGTSVNIFQKKGFCLKGDVRGYPPSIGSIPYRGFPNGEFLWRVSREGFHMEDSLRGIPFEGEFPLKFRYVHVRFVEFFLFSVLVFISFPDLIDFEIL